MTMQTFTPMQYLMIDVASSFGLDKKTWDERLEWFAQNQGEIENIDPLTPASLSIVRRAKEPAMFFAGATAWKAAKHGKPIGYAISLDATASGAQILSVLVGDEASARLCNVVDTGNREDLYTNVHQLMAQRLEDQWDLQRDQVKDAVMTALYGSQAQPRKVFGTGERLKGFYDTMEQDLAGIWQLNCDLLDMWNPDADSYHWTMPDNFHVNIKVMDDVMGSFTFEGVIHKIKRKVNRPVMEGLSMPANLTHSIDGMLVREIMARCSYNQVQVAQLKKLLKAPALYALPDQRPQDALLKTIWGHYQKSGFLSARVIDLLDENNLHLVDMARIAKLIESLPVKPFSVLAVHDCFRVHPNYGNDLRRQMNQIMAELSRSEILSFLCQQLTNKAIQVQKYADLAPRIEQANYILS